MTNQKTLITGSAGFIGFHLSRKLLEQGQAVMGIDNVNNYYDVGLKQDRLAILKNHPEFQFSQIDMKANQVAIEIGVWIDNRISHSRLGGQINNALKVVFLKECIHLLLVFQINLRKLKFRVIL